ncbi:beta-hexosaminidase [Hypoxylon argillaceum]|nr:beta-hexosaminidase [Hypoxylon argillaceum]
MMAFFYLAQLCILATLYTVVSSVVLAGPRAIGIPTIPFNASDGGRTYPIQYLKSIIVDEAYTDWVDELGETLIPPTLHQFAGVFAGDFFDIWQIQNISQTEASSPQPHSVFLTISENYPYRYASGEQASEAYEWEVTTGGIVIRGASPLGVWWGTRSLLHLSVLSDGNLPIGKSVDVPGWKIRGMMLDAGRHYYPSEFVSDLCAYMSFFKQNTLHLHLSDNLYNNVKLYSREQSLSLYARFRLWSDADAVKGLNNFKNESYTEDDYKAMQLACAARGVTIIPEIEAPGHALPIVQWKPELGLSSDLSLLNISHPDTIPTMKTIWSTFFDWFETRTVHIGADEYTGDVGEYNRFVNEMADFIRTNGSKNVRIWGTFPPKPDYENIHTNVSIQHWEYFEDNPLFDYIQNNYSVVNSDDTFYVVNKWSGSYPQKVNVAKTFHGNPASGGPWHPNIFDTNNATNNPGRTSAAVLGAVAPLWNDFGPNATTYTEAYYAWRDGIPALADKQWGGDLLTEEFMVAFPRLVSAVPGQNLERRVTSKTDMILRYEQASWTPVRQGQGGAMWISDLSGNGLDASTDCAILGSDSASLAITGDCFVDTPLLSKGRDYALTMRLRLTRVDEGDVTIIQGSDSTLMLTPNITLFTAGNYYRLNTTLPMNAWIDLSIVARGERTFASVKAVDDVHDPLVEARAVSRDEIEFLAVLGINGESLVWAPIAVEAPITKLGNGGWEGEFAGMVFSSKA